MTDAKGTHPAVSKRASVRRGRRGSVLMEYLILLVFVGAVLAITSHRLLFSSYIDDEDGTEKSRLGPLGEQIQGFYQRTMGGLALPVP